jgi:hypothetical protein
MKTLNLKLSATRTALSVGLLLVVAAFVSSVSTSTASAAAVAPAKVPTAPARSADGTYYITEPGVYSGHFDCPGISTAQFCVHVWNDQGVVLENFAITTSGLAIQADSYTTLRYGEIWGHGGLSAHSETGITVDGVAFNVTGGAIGLYDTSGSCEGLATKRSYYHLIINSSFTNRGGNETIWAKCTQSVSILYNTFRSGSQWSISLPDSRDVWIHGNSFSLSGAPSNWLAIELPRSHNVWIAWNWFGGRGNAWGVWANSGTSYVTIEGNCATGAEILTGEIIPVWVFGNYYC